MTELAVLYAEAWARLRGARRFAWGALGLVALAAFGALTVRASQRGTSLVSIAPGKLGATLLMSSAIALLLDLARALVLIACNRGEPSLWAAIKLVPRLITLSVLELLPTLTLLAGGVLAAERLILSGRLGVARHWWLYAALGAPLLALSVLVFAAGRVAQIVVARVESPSVALAVGCNWVLGRPLTLLRLFVAWAALGAPAMAVAAGLACLGVGLNLVAALVLASAVIWLYAILSVGLGRDERLAFG